MNAHSLDLTGMPWRIINLNVKHDAWCLVDAIDYAWLSEFTCNISWGSWTPWQLYAKRNVGPHSGDVADAPGNHDPRRSEAGSLHGGSPGRSR